MTERPSGDPFAPAKEHAELLAEARDRARTDAARHAEDLLDRELPFVREAETLGQHRLVRLGHRRQELLGAAENALAAATAAWTGAKERLDASNAALRSEGVPADQLALGPLTSPISPRSMAIALAVITVAASVGGAFWLGPVAATIALLACLALAGALGVAVYAPNGPWAENAYLAALRRERAHAGAELSDSGTRRGNLSREIDETIPRRAQNLLEGELAFVRELASTYEGELFRSLPPGALADGQGLGVQRAPVLTMPVWAEPGTA